MSGYSERTHGTRRAVQTGICWYVYTPLCLTRTQSCFCGCVYCSGFFSTSFQRKFIWVGCRAVRSEHRCSVLRRKWQLNCFVLDSRALHEVGTQGNDVTELKQLLMIFDYSLMSVFFSITCVNVVLNQKRAKISGGKVFGSDAIVLVKISRLILS